MAIHPSLLRTPSFTHDCDACTFLGHRSNHDLYVCFANGCFTYIARYGNTCDAYCSLPAKVVRMCCKDGDILKAALDAHVDLLGRVLDADLMDSAVKTITS